MKDLRPSFWLAVPCMILAAAACTETPDSARAKLEKKNIAVTPENLVAKTKDPKDEAAKLLVIAGADPNARQANGMTALMSAVFNGQQDVARELLERGANVNATAKTYTALHMAVERGDKDMVKLLLDKGADPGLRPDGAPSALSRAEALGKADLVALLKERGGK